MPGKWSKEKQRMTYYVSLSFSPVIFSLAFSIGVIGTIVHNRMKEGMSDVTNRQERSESPKPNCSIVLLAAAESIMPSTTIVNETPSIAEDSSIENSLGDSHMRSQVKYISVSPNHKANENFERDSGKVGGVQAQQVSTPEENSDSLSLDSYVYMKSLETKFLDDAKPKKSCENAATEVKTEGNGIILLATAQEAQARKQGSTDMKSYIHMRRQYKEDTIITKPNEAYENAKLMNKGNGVKTKGSADQTKAEDDGGESSGFNMPDSKPGKAYENEPICSSEPDSGSQKSWEKLAAEEGIVDDEDVYGIVDHEKMKEQWKKFKKYFNF